MNGTYFSNPTFIQDNDEEEIINQNIGSNNNKIVTIHTKFEKELTGRIEVINKKFIIINDINNNEYYLILFDNINYISSKEALN